MKKRSLVTIISITCLIILSTINTQAKDPPLEALCQKISSKIDTLLDTKNTTCIPSRSNQKGKYSLIIISAENVFNNEQSKRAFILAITGVVGWALSDLPETKRVNFDEILITDPNLARQYKYLAVRAGTLKTIRKRLYNGQIDGQTAYKLVNIELVVKKSNS